MQRSPRKLGHAYSPSWPEHLVELADVWHGNGSARAKEKARSEIWILLVAALELAVRQRCGTRYDLDADLAYDLAAKRALELFTDFARGVWDPRSYAPGQLQSYFNLLARNSVVDYVRSREGQRRAREIHCEEEANEQATVAPDIFAADRKRLAVALVRCVSLMTKRARTIWFLRAFLELSSREIGCHPEVNMRSTAVDMALFRCRKKMRTCLETSGFDETDFGPGVFTACWEAFEASESIEPHARKDETRD